MRHKYETRGLVLSRSPLGEANAFITMLTPELGLIRARAQGVRRMGAKLAPALATLAESSVVLVRGKEGWRLAGAVLEENWFKRLTRAAARERAARVSGLLLRLVTSETHEPMLFPLMRSFFQALSDVPEDLHTAAETVAVLGVLAALGFDGEAVPGESVSFAPAALVTGAEKNAHYIARINQGIEASGL